VLNRNKINALNLFEKRRVEFCPPYFEYVVINPSYNLLKAIDDWIYDNLSGRYYLGKTVDLEETNSSIRSKYKIAFENPKELSYFMLACPHLKYRN
jgi:hypothetical protein